MSVCMLTNFEKSLQKYIQAFVPEKDLKLERIAWLLQKLGNPQHAFPIIHVGGTSGKGSSCLYCEKILQAHGYTTGCFMSPYVEDIRESFLINGELGEEGILQELLDQLAPHLEECQQQLGSHPSYFEIKCALALLYFRLQKLDVAILEVGIGGTLDATNLVESEVAVVVSIGYDHTDILGETLQEIAENKFGIIKPQSHFVCGATQADIQKLACRRATEKQAQIYTIGEHFAYHFRQDGLLDVTLPDQQFEGLQVFPQASYLGHNISCALMAASLFLEKRAQSLEVEKVQASLQNAHLPARFEIVSHKPLVILDGAHNQDKLTALLEAMRLVEYSELYLVFSLKQGEQRNARIYPLVSNIRKLKKVLVTSFHASSQVMSEDPEQILLQLQHHLDVRTQLEICEDPKLAFEQARAEAAESGCILVTGSLYLVGEVRNYSRELLIKCR